MYPRGLMSAATAAAHRGRAGIGHVTRPVCQMALFISAFMVLGWFVTVLGLDDHGWAADAASIGLAAGVAVRTSGRRRQAVLAATVVSTAMLGTLVLRARPDVWALLGVANACEAAALALVLRRLGVGHLATVSQAARFLLAATLTGAAAAAAAVAVLHPATPLPVGEALTIRMMSHLVGLVVVATPLVAWAGIRPLWTAGLTADVTAWAMLLAVITLVGFDGSVAGVAFPYLPLAVVLFAAVRLGSPAAAVLLPLLVPAAVWFSARGDGPFASMARGETAKVIAVLLFCLTASVTCWLVAARQSEACTAARSLADANARLEEANADLEKRVATRTAALERAAASASLTAQIAQALAEARLDLTATMNAVAGSLAPLGDVCVVSRIVPGTDAIEPVAVAASTDDLRRAAERAWSAMRINAASPGLTGRALATGRPVRAGGSPQELADVSHPALQPLFTRHGLHSALVAPMHDADGVVGSLVLVRGGSRPPFDASEERLVQDLADRSGLAVSNAILHDELADRARTDPLTGLANRRLLHEQLSLALRRLERNPGLVAVIFADLDDFKTINDTMGHEAGDRLLVHFADRLRGVLRGTDTAGRVGGDEFVAVCSGLTQVHAVHAIADRLAVAARTPLVLGGQIVHPRASVGFAVSDCALTDPDELLRRADTAMYEAKRCGSADAHLFDAARNTPQHQVLHSVPR